MASGTPARPEPTIGFDDDDLTEAFFGPAAGPFKTQEA
jgi:hypothetical protein